MASKCTKLIVAALTAAIVGAASPGAALAGDTAAADALFTEAKALADAKKFAEACPKFEASYKLDRAVGTLMNLADCHEQVGRIATAWSEWNESYEWLVRDNDKRSKFAGTRRDGLLPRLPRLTINVTNPSPRLQVYRDATVIEEGAYNSALPVDPGDHAITVRRGDEVLKEEKVSVEEKGSASVAFDLTAIEKAAPPPKPGGGGNVVVGPPPVKSPQKAIGFVVGGVGVAAFLAAAALEVGALTGKSGTEEADQCLNKFCSPKGIDTVNRLGTYAEVGQWVGIGGILLTGVGLTLVLTAPAAPPASSPEGLPSTRARNASPRFSASVAPYAGPTGGGITILGHL